MLSVRELRKLRLNFSPDKSVGRETYIASIEQILDYDGTLDLILCRVRFQNTTHFPTEQLDSGKSVRFGLDKHRHSVAPPLSHIFDFAHKKRNIGVEVQHFKHIELRPNTTANRDSIEVVANVPLASSIDTDDKSHSGCCWSGK